MGLSNIPCAVAAFINVLALLTDAINICFAAFSLANGQ
jgi:hypothetical protein